MKKTIGIIPLRAGSKSIPGKNKKKIFGRALYQWTLSEGLFSDLDKLYIFTDDVDILEQVKNEYHWTSKVKIVHRSAESATDTASTEKAMLELAQSIEYDFDIICLIQATSPLTSRQDINNCFKSVKDGGYDSALTVVENKRFIWNLDGDSINYDYKFRPRRQDFKGLYIENGAVYAVKKEVFLESQNRLGGKIAIVEMPGDTLTEIDEQNDWLVMEKLIENRLLINKKHPKKIKAFILDVDGVFTDGKVAVSNDIELFKTFSLRDGMGIDILMQNNVLPIVLTSENSPIVKTRMKKLNISHTYMGIKDKFAFLDHLCNELNIYRNEIAYIGDDINDLPNLASVAWSFCPSNAVDTVKPFCDIVLINSGGDKAIREAIEFIIKINHRY